MINKGCRWYACGLLLLAGGSALTCDRTQAAEASMAGLYIHVFTWVTGYKITGNNDIFCSAPGTKMYISTDNGTGDTVTVSIHDAPSSKDLPLGCTKLVVAGTLYSIDKKTLNTAEITSRGWVTGILAVPFKFHIANKSTTAGSTVGGYVGFRTNFYNSFTITPIVAGGLALISTQPAQVQTGNSSTPTGSNTGTQTSTGFSVAAGLIGSASNSGASGAQFGVLVGLDWLGKSTNYQYEGKPWIAFEIGYNFSQ